MKRAISLVLSVGLAWAPDARADDAAVMDAYAQEVIARNPSLHAETLRRDAFYSEARGVTWMDPLVSVKRESELFREIVAIRLRKEDSERLDRLAAKIPIATKHAVARNALMIGVAYLEKHPTYLLGGGDSERRPRTSRRRK